MNVLRSLKYRPFALLWTRQTTSRLSDSLYRIAPSWWVLLAYLSILVTGFVLLPFAFRLPVSILVVCIFVGGIGVIALVLLGLSHPAIRKLD